MRKMEVKDYIELAKQSMEAREIYRKKVRKFKFDTIAVHGMYGMQEAIEVTQGSVVEPIFPSTSQRYRDSNEMEAGLSYLIPSWAYSRIHNPTNFFLEETLALLETYKTDIEATALCTSSGMSAIKQAIEPLVVQKENFEKENINFVSSSQVYGGTFQLFSLRMKERGVVVRWISNPGDINAWEEQIDDSTRFLYAEMPSNPQQSCVDISSLSLLAKKYFIPLIIDATISTPALLRPLGYGADIVIHSLTKSIGSSGTAVGGAIIARYNLVSKFLSEEQMQNYCLWLKLWPFRDSGPCLSSNSAYMFLQEIKTLRIKMQHYSKNTEKVVAFLSNHPKIEEVFYLGLPSHSQHDLASKYMRLADSHELMYGHLCSFNILGSVSDTRKFFDRLELISRATDLGRVKSVATIPSISTHQQQGEEGRALANISPNMVRLCVGGEDSEDVIADLEHALNTI